MTLSIVNINPHTSPIDFLCIWVFIICAVFCFFSPLYLLTLWSGWFYLHELWQQEADIRLQLQDVLYNDLLIGIFWLDGFLYSFVEKHTCSDVFMNNMYRMVSSKVEFIIFFVFICCVRIVDVLNMYILHFLMWINVFNMNFDFKDVVQPKIKMTHLSLITHFNFWFIFGTQIRMTW